MRFRILRVVALAAFATGALSTGLFAVEQGDRAPAWRANDFAGRPVDFPAVGEGKPIVVVFWATWCGYCRAFMPYLKGIQADYAAHGVKIVAINAKEDGRDDPKAYVQNLGFAELWDGQVRTALDQILDR
jgi:thiol-disulfide isomerase/thioredoxin